MQDTLTIVLCVYNSPTCRYGTGKKKTKKKKTNISIVPPTPTTSIFPLTPLSPPPAPLNHSLTKYAVHQVTSIAGPTTPLSGQEFTVVQVTTPGQFFIQSLTYPTTVVSLLARIPPHQPPRQSWTIDDYCLAAFNGEKWYRGKILKLVDGNFEVSYIDFGNSAILPASELAIIPPSLVEFPAQAMEVALAGVRPIDSGGVWNLDCSLYFSNLVLEKRVTVTVQVRYAVNNW